jgi:hypothetical protein
MAVNRIIIIVVSLLFFNTLFCQNTFISDIDEFNELKVNRDKYLYTGFLSWYGKKCFSKQEKTCIQRTHGGVRLYLKSADDIVEEKIQIDNNAGYKIPAFDTLIYKINYKDLKKSTVTRKMYFEEKYIFDSEFEIDTFQLKPIDTLFLKKRSLIRRIFKKEYRQGLRIYVFHSTSVEEDDTLHFWVDGIGIIKVVYEDCWRYSFELDFRDYLSNRKNKLFKELLFTIKEKYKDPKWLDAPCNITYKK